MASEEWNALSKESPIVDALNIIGGRPALDRIVPRFVAGAEGKSLVVGQSPCLFALLLELIADASLISQLADLAQWPLQSDTK